jgi:hypothetical protein
VEPTVEPTVTPTAEITPTVEVAGEIGAAAITGSWTSEIIAIQNLSTASPASVSLQLYQTTDTPVQTIGPTSIPVGGSASIASSQITNDGRYSGVINSSEPVAVSVLQRNATFNVADVHVGLSNVAQSLIIARVFNEHYGYITRLHVQNAHTSAQNINVKLFVVGNSLPTVDHTYNSVPANTGFTIDINTDPLFSAYPKGNDVSLGYARIAGASGNVAVVADSIRDTGNVLERIQVSLPGLPDTESAVFGETLILPRVFNVHYSWDTGIPVVNLSGVSTSATLVYTNQDGNNYTTTKSLAANGGQSFFLPTDFPGATGANGGDATGGVTVKCNDPGCQIVAVANNVYKGQNSSDPNGAFNYPAVKGANATNNAAVPIVHRQGSGFTSSQWITGIVVYNVEGGTITTKWVKAGTDPTNPANVVTWSQSGTAGKVTTFYPVNTNSALDNFGTGSVFVSSTGKILVSATYNLNDAKGGTPASRY